jgi:hypothetical protein
MQVHGGPSHAIYANIAGRGAAGADGELVVGVGQAHAQVLGFPAPALPLCLRDPRCQVVTNLLQPSPLTRVNAQDWASDATVLVLAAGAVGPAAFAEGDLAPFEVAEELVPFLIGRSPIFFAGT